MEDVTAIDPNKQYRPQEIFKAGWIVNNYNQPNYKYILRLINAGKLKARNASFADTVKYYLVMGRDIINFRKDTYGLDTPIQEPQQSTGHVLSQG